VNRLVTADEVAVFLSLNPSWVYAEARAGRIPQFRIRRYRRFSLEWIEEWAKELERGTHKKETVCAQLGRRRTSDVAGGCALVTLGPDFFLIEDTFLERTDCG
jgi:excisionase family DNA binding protein